MHKQPVLSPISHPFTLDEVQCILREGYLHYLTVQFFTGLRIGEADARKEVHHG